MKKELIKLAKKYNFTNIEVEFVDNFDWKYYCVSMDDKDGQGLEYFDFEYCIYDEGYKEKYLKGFECFLKEQLK